MTHMTLNIDKLVSALKAKRAEEGLSLRKLSTQIGVSFSTLARIERGDGEPDNNSALRMLEWLGKDGERAGLSFDNVALVHFRAAKNAGSNTIGHLLQVAGYLKQNHPKRAARLETKSSTKSSDGEFETPPLVLSKPDMEDMANNLRHDLGLGSEDQFPALAMKINGVEVIAIGDANAAPSESLAYLSQEGADDWSAMSVPMNEDFSEWVIVRNNTHTIERQRVTYLEECWHILLGHKLTKVAKIGNAYGRTYESSEEHDAFYLASACLLPEEPVSQKVRLGWTADQIGDHFGTSPELAEYRIKRLGLWRTYKGLQIEIGE